MVPKGKTQSQACPQRGQAGSPLPWARPEIQIRTPSEREKARAYGRHDCRTQGRARTSPLFTVSPTHWGVLQLAERGFLLLF